MSLYEGTEVQLDINVPSRTYHVPSQTSETGLMSKMGHDMSEMGHLCPIVLLPLRILAMCFVFSQCVNTASHTAVEHLRYCIDCYGPTH